MTSRFSTLVLVCAATGCLDTADLGGGSTSGGDEGSSTAPAPETTQGSSTEETSSSTSTGGGESSTDVPVASSSSSSSGGESSGTESGEPPEGGLGPWGFGYVELGGVAREVAIEDFDDDGNLDIVAQRRQDGAWQLETWAGAGDGSFTSIGQSTVTGWNVVLRAADFDGDGNVDLAAFDDYHGESFAVAFGDGAGGFGDRTSVAVEGFFGFGVQPMRYDDDALADLFIPQGHSTPNVVARGVPDVGFEPAATVEPIGCYVSEAAAGDLDGDGLDEIVATGSCNSIPDSLPLVVYRHGPEGFAVGQFMFAYDGPVIEGGRVVLVDADGDGDVDVVTPTAQGLYFVAGDGTGALVDPPVVWAHAYGSKDPFEEAIRRVIPIVRPEDDAVMFLLATETATGDAGLVAPSAPGVLETTELDVQGRMVGTGDFDGDGRPDVVVLVGDEANGVLQGSIGVWLSGG